MQTSLQGIANKARMKKENRFENLIGLLNVQNTLDSWRLLNKKAAYGVDKVSAEEYEQNLQENVEELIEQGHIGPSSSEGGIFQSLALTSKGRWGYRLLLTSYFRRW